MKEEYLNILKKAKYKDLQLEKKLADASNRKYYRFKHSKGSLILMQMNSFDRNKDRFILTHCFFSKININVPEIYLYDEKKGIIVLEDLGDQTIKQENETVIDYEAKYIKAIDVLLKYQTKSTKHLNSYPMTYAFNFSKFYNELILFKYYYLNLLKTKLNKNINKKNKFFDKLFFDKLFKEIVLKLLKQKFLLAHRDFHSRNLMFLKNKVYLIDFQDARKAPYTYDLASLILDPYANIDDELSEKLIKKYYKKTCFESYDSFYYNYNLALLQRALKIIGTFAYQSLKKNNSSYLKYIPITLDKINKLKNIFPEWKIILEEILN
jgi:N-acetylmuramate 1-kinase